MIPEIARRSNTTAPFFSPPVFGAAALFVTVLGDAVAFLPPLAPVQGLGFVPDPRVEQVTQHCADFGDGELGMFFSQPLFLKRQEPQRQQGEGGIVHETSDNLLPHLSADKLPSVA